ncbi:MAG: ECF-type sigma factor, partial [Terriglobales bacterium]
MPESGEITRLIAEWQAGNKSAEETLFEAMYRELQRIAAHILRTERPGQTLGATALVHEA